MCHFLLVNASCLFLLYNTLSKGSKNSNLLSVMVKKEDFHQKFQYHGFSLYFFGGIFILLSIKQTYVGLVTADFTKLLLVAQSQMLLFFLG